jgi:hypothetical protein
MDKIPFRIFKIENDPIELHADLVDKKSTIEFSFQVSFNGDLKNRIIGCKTDYVFKQKDTIISSLTVYCYFMIEEEFVKSKTVNNKLELSKDFLRYLATISVGTARGIQHAKTQGTDLNSLVIPPINLVSMDIQDFVIEEN